MIPEVFICGKCKHFFANIVGESRFGCRAFPDEIPDGIGGINSHNEVIEGQVGDFVFAPIQLED